MKLAQKLLNHFNGLHYPQEYLCLAKESFTDPLYVYLVNKEQVVRNITDTHLFVGYNPLIFALTDLKYPDLEQATTIYIIFTPNLLHPNEKFSAKDAIATLELQKINQQFIGNNVAYLFEGLKGKHRFNSTFHQCIIGLANRLNNKPGNVFLHDNLYKQVQIAYSIPRNISLITIGENGKYNLFPTDLHGETSNDHYVISLRHTGKACRQVEQTKRILISTIHSRFYLTTYLLGKNHMQELKEKSHFPFCDEVSVQFSLPVPQSALLTRELELQDSVIYGIHRVLLFKILSRQQWDDTPSTLSHIHNVYATWRYNNGMAGNYLLR